MQDKTAITITALLCITALELCAIAFLKIDGALLSTIVGSIVFVATRQHYKPQKSPQEMEGM